MTKLSHKLNHVFFDHSFIEMNTVGFSEMLAEVDKTPWEKIHQYTGLTPTELAQLAKLYVDAKTAIFCWGMGITQHRHGTANVQMLANLMLARGLIGRPGSGLAPIRGHSNVQGDRTVGINENPSDKFLKRLDEVFGINTPKNHGLGVVDTIAAMGEGKVKVFIGLGGNFAMATPDTVYTHKGLRSCNLTVHITTKLNRSHLVCGKDALILPCLGRTEVDNQLHGPQAVSVEDSMSNVHLSAGRNEPISPDLLSEPDIVARMAEATLPNTKINWKSYIENYDRIRNSIADVFDESHDFNIKVYQPGGFHLEHPANMHVWNTPSGKAQFIIHPFDEVYADTEHQYVMNYSQKAKIYMLMTTRSHDQYNTTVYGLDDRYRGVFGQRRVLFMNEEDIKDAGFEADQWVDIESIYADGVKRIVQSFRIVPYQIPRGSLAAYFPETNPLIALSSHDQLSKIPASKSVPVILHPGQAPAHFNLAEVVNPQEIEQITEQVG